MTPIAAGRTVEKWPDRAHLEEDMMRRRWMVVAGALGTIGAVAVGSSVAAQADSYRMYCTPYADGSGGSCAEVYIDGNGNTTVHSYGYNSSGGWWQNW